MKQINVLSRYPFGVAAEVISLDRLERGTEHWTYERTPVTRKDSYNREGETPKAQ